MPLGTISHVKRSAAHMAMLILSGRLSRPEPRICRTLSSQSHPKGTRLHEPESCGTRNFCAAETAASDSARRPAPQWRSSSFMWIKWEKCGHLFLRSTGFSLTKTKSTSVGSHAALSSQWGPSHVKLHFIVSMEHTSPSKRKGYFLHHPPPTTTSARSCHVLERRDKAKKKKKKSSQQKNHFSLLPSVWIQSARVQGCYQALWSSPFPGYDSQAEMVWEVLLPRDIK